MTGFDEASQWLAQNAPKWRLVRGESRLVAGAVEGAPTLTRAIVWAVREDEYGDATVQGEGATYVEAVRNAVGVIERSGGTTVGHNDPTEPS